MSKGSSAWLPSGNLLWAPRPTDSSKARGPAHHLHAYQSNVTARVGWESAIRISSCYVSLLGCWLTAAVWTQNYTNISLSGGDGSNKFTLTIRPDRALYAS